MFKQKRLIFGWAVFVWAFSGGLEPALQGIDKHAVLARRRNATTTRRASRDAASNPLGDAMFKQKRLIRR
jgi:hypothetical protein